MSGSLKVGECTGTGRSNRIMACCCSAGSAKELRRRSLRRQALGSSTLERPLLMGCGKGPCQQAAATIMRQACAVYIHQQASGHKLQVQIA